MTVTVEYDDAVKLLEKAVEAGGADKVVNDCIYTLDGVTGCCIVGKVLEFVGADMQTIYHTDTNDMAVDSVDWEAGFGIKFSKQALWLLVEAQNLQDRKTSWGTAVELAKKVVRHG